MTAATKTQLRRAIFESIAAPLKRDGFELKVSKNTFIRKQDDGLDIFMLVCRDGKPGLRVQPEMGRRIHHVEQIFHKTSGFEPKFQKDTPTVGGAVGEIVYNHGRDCEFLVELESEVSSTSEQILKIFYTFALPYFEKYKSLTAIDAELNDKPTERTPNRAATWLRCATGVIVAKLTGRPDYEQLAKIYTDVMRRVGGGFYLERFLALVKSLD